MLLPWVPVNADSCSGVPGPLSEMQACTELNFQVYAISLRSICRGFICHQLAEPSRRGATACKGKLPLHAAAMHCRTVHRVLPAAKGRRMCQLTLCYTHKVEQAGGTAGVAGTTRTGTPPT